MPYCSKYKKSKYAKAIYHRTGCPHLQAISQDNIMYVSDARTEKFARYYKPCKYCYGIEKSEYIFRNRIENLAASHNLDIKIGTYPVICYIKSQVGFWKVILSSEDGKVGHLLYHRNEYHKEWPIWRLEKGEYHRQTDVRDNASLGVILSYIEDHDKAKRIANGNYKQLPRDTKKQKKYYKMAKSNESRKEQQRVQEILNQWDREKERKVSHS